MVSLRRAAATAVAGVALAAGLGATPALAETKDAIPDQVPSIAAQAVTAGLEGPGTTVSPMATPAPVSEAKEEQATQPEATQPKAEEESRGNKSAAPSQVETAKKAEGAQEGESIQGGEANQKVEPAQEPAEQTLGQGANAAAVEASEAKAQPSEQPTGEESLAKAQAFSLMGEDAADDATTQDAADVTLGNVTFTRTDASYDASQPSRISMTDQRTFQVTVGVQGVTAAQLQKMVNDGKVSFSLVRDKGIMDPAVYPKQWLGGRLDQWMTVATSDRYYRDENNKRTGKTYDSQPLFTDVKVAVSQASDTPSLVCTFGNRLLFGMNGIDCRARSTVRSAMMDYVGAYQLRCDLAGGQSAYTTVDLRPFDEYYTQEEIDAELPRLVKQANDNGIYAKLENFGTSAEGRQMTAVFVAESQKDLDDYQALKARMEADPAAVQRELAAGRLSYKVPVFYSNVHSDELSAAEGVMQFLKDLVGGRSISYRRITGLTDEGKKELAAEMEADGTVWSDLIKGKATGVGYIRGNGGKGNGGYEDSGTRSNSGLNDSSSDLSEADFAKYYTLAQETFDPKEILKHVFFILVPSENVDARAVNVRTNGNGFDLNRDNTYQTQPETQAMSGLITKWDPISLHEFHGFYQQFQIEPCSPTHDPNNEYDLFIDTAMEQGEYFASVALANNPTINSAQIPMRDYLKRQKDGSVMWDSPFDDMSASYTPQYAMMHGTNAYTVEVPVGNSDAVHAIAGGCIGNAQFVAQNKDRMFNNLLERYRRGIENIDAATIRPYYVNQHDKQGAEADVFRPQDNENHNFFPEYYVIPMDAASQEDRAAARDMVAYLLHNGVKVSQLTQDTTVGGKTYKAGTMVVNMRQAKRNMANAALYPNLVISDWTQYSLYSEPVSNFAAFRGFDMDTIRTKGAFAASSLANVTAAPDPKTIVVGQGPVTIIRNDSLQPIQAVNDLLHRGAKVGLITAGDNEGDYVVASSDFDAVKDSYVLYATQGTATPTARRLRNDIKVYVPKAYDDFVTDADGNEVGMKGYNNRLNTNGNWDPFALAKQMGFTLTDNLDDATIIVGSQYPANYDAVAAKVRAGVPYVGYTADALQFVKDAGLADISFTGENWDWMGYDALDTVEFPTDDIVTATYREEGDNLMYGYGGSYFVSVPKGARILIKTTGDKPVEGFMTAEYLEKYKGQIQAISLLDDDVDMVLFANTLTNKAHQQDDYRYLTASLFSRSEAGDFATIDTGKETGGKDDTGKTEEGGEKGTTDKGETTSVPIHSTAPDAEDRVTMNPENNMTLRQAAERQRTAAQDKALPQTGDYTVAADGLAGAGFVILASGLALVLVRHREQE